MSETSPLVKLLDAGLRKGGQWLVRGVTFSVNAGEIVTLIGPNGSGKSTTAKLALGIRSPSEGKAIRRSDLKVGYVPQKLEVDWTFPLTVERFIHLTHKLPKKVINDAIDKVGLSGKKNSELTTLSGGEFQRALIARAIAHRPNLLVLDEPVQGVDFNGELELYDLIDMVREQLNCGVLLISHDLHLVMASTDLVICLNGHMCCHGPPTMVAASEEYRALFGARAAAGLAVYEHAHDHKHLPDGRVQLDDGSIVDQCPPAESGKSARLRQAANPNGSPDRAG